jgi:hypothetical protein
MMGFRTVRCWTLRLAAGLALWPAVAAAAEAKRPAAGSFTAAQYEEHLRLLGAKIPAKGFTVVVSPPFVVIGDEPPEVVRRRAENTVHWAVERLKAAYFRKDPAAILDIWLFKDKESYEAHCKSIFHKPPGTPFGYYSHEEKALIMNISTGGGTLVHEIVHPFVAADFPGCPPWLNEGLGSLYEQCGEEDGRIHGYTNWRLPGLQEAIRHKRVPPFEKLCAMTEDDFYTKDRGTNYGQSRYLCYYLQQQGLLEKFYHRFHDNAAKDPTGYATLQAVLGGRDIDVFQADWEAYVLKLRFR